MPSVQESSEMKRKILINDYPKVIRAERQELPENTLVEFYNERGDKYHISFSNVVEGGLEIRLVRAGGGDQMLIYPRSANQIEVL